MKIHEYQAKSLLKAYKIPVSQGVMVESAQAAAEAAAAMNGNCVIKAQVHAGGRGKAGGIKIAHTPVEAYDIAKQMLGSRLVTRQTGPEGKIIRKLLVDTPLEIKKEYYIGITFDYEKGEYVAIASGAGGTEIEEIAAKSPELIVKQSISVTEGLKGYHAINIAEQMGLPGGLVQEFTGILRGLFRLMTDKDCTLVEINPLVLAAEGKLMALDAKVDFDDNALLRHPEILELRDEMEEDPKEILASKNGLNYVAMDGVIGCMVNGAGLAMATMDIIHSFGASPANFLDVGGNATQERVEAAFQILLSDTNVKVILVNIFGGIMKCDIIAAGIVAVATKQRIEIPIVVRLEGTNVDLGKKILRESGMEIIVASDMADAASKCIQSIA